MADGDLLDYLDKSDLNVDHTPNRQLGIGDLSGSSVRKLGKFHKLYTPRESPSVDDGTENSPVPFHSRRRLSSTSHNATIGNGSHIDSSFGVVDVTPGADGLQSLSFQSYLRNYASAREGNFKVTPKSMQHCKPLGNSVNKNDFEKLSSSPESLKTHAAWQKTMKEETERLLERKGSKSPGVNGITSLWATKIPAAVSSKCRNPVCSLDGSSSVVRDRQTEATSHAKLGGLGHFSQLTPSRSEQVKSPQMPPLCGDEEKDELPATQPVSSLLLKGQCYQLVYQIRINIHTPSKWKLDVNLPFLLDQFLFTPPPFFSGENVPVFSA